VVLYFRRKHLLNRSGVDWTDYNCNHYVGCAHNCQYPCYARLISKKKESEWTQVAIVENALELAVREIRHVRPDSTIMVSSMTDPYQPIEKTEKLTRALIPVLASRQNVTVIVITKSDLVRRDFGLIEEFPNVKLCMTITSSDNISDFEPNAPGNAARIKCLEEARDLGIYTIASIEPWIPEVTKPIQLVRLIYPYIKEVFIGSWNWHFRRGSTPQQKAARHYRAWLPYVTKFLEDHMIKYTIKKELHQLVDSVKTREF